MNADFTLPHLMVLATVFIPILMVTLKVARWLMK